MKPSVNLIERSRQNFKEKAATIPIHDNFEELLCQKAIEQRGILCLPFWEQADDLEGKCYRTYMVEHPDFNLCLRMSVVDRLVNVQKLLPAEWSLVLKAGFRPFSVQLALLEALIKDVKLRNSGWSDEAILEHARSYVADPRIGCPPHTTGGAVDIDILHADSGKPINMGCPPNTDDERAALHSTTLSADEYSNRLILLEAMLKCGFAPNHNEWWHYSYGDTRWAAFYKQRQTLYGIIKD